MNMNLMIYALALIAFGISACAPAGQKTKKPDPKLAATYIAQAQTVEKSGELPEALEQYKLALTVDPQNKVAGENISRLSEKLSVMAEERYKLGMKYHRIGKYGLAKKEFLTALKFDPEHKGASGMLVSRQPEKTPAYTFHVIQPGESLSSIAKKYYGDYKRYDVIAKFNRLEDVTTIKPGQRLMIPEEEGFTPSPSTSFSEEEEEETSFVFHTIKPGESVSKLAQLYYGDYKLFHAIAQYNGMDDATRVTVGEKIRVPKLVGVPFTPPDPANGMPTETSRPDQKKNEMALDMPSAPSINGDEQVLAYRDAGIEYYNEQKYEDAVFELNKAIEASPNDPATREYLAKAYFEAGKQHFQEQDFEAAREAFESAHQYNPGCKQCQAYIDKSKLGPLLANRSKGIDSFEKNDYLSAIFQFQAFLQTRPDDQEIRLYMSKAHYQQALIAFGKGDFLTAKKGFDSALEYDSQCEKCGAYIEQSIRNYKESHYNKGIVYFGKEQLPEAIAEWEMVYELDHDFKDVDQNLKKARSLLERLEKIKKSRQ